MRALEEIRADLARCDRDGTPWPAAARRLLADIPDLLGVVQAVEALAKDPVHECGETCEAWGCDAKGATYYVTLPKLRAVLAAAADAPQPEDEPERVECGTCHGSGCLPPTGTQPDGWAEGIEDTDPPPCPNCGGLGDVADAPQPEKASSGLLEPHYDCPYCQGVCALNCSHDCFGPPTKEQQR